MQFASFLTKHPVELVLIITSSILSVASFSFFYFQNSSEGLNSHVLGVENDIAQQSDSYFIDVSGAVLHPDLYEVTPGARLKDVIDMAGGLSEEADSQYVGRNFNMAKVLVDEEKIYIPFVSDILNGTIPETNTISNKEMENPVHSEFSISINSASIEELDTLPGVGPATAQKIIDNRPYSAVDELLDKKVMSSTAFSKIKDLVGI